MSRRFSRCMHFPTRRLRRRPLPLSGEGFMRAIAQRLVRGAFAGAEPDFLVGFRLPFLRPEFRAFVRAVAERLRFRAPAGAPPVAFAGRDVDRNRPPSADFRHAAHITFSAPLMDPSLRLRSRATPRRTLWR